MAVQSLTKTFYTHLVCSSSGEVYDKNLLQTFSRLHKPLLAQYDLSVRLERSVLQHRPRTMWRYREMLPVENTDHIVTLGEGMTPLLPLRQAGNRLGLEHLWLKDEAYNPTGSFKARGLAMAVSKARELGVEECAIPTAGNAGGALSAYCAKAGMRAHVFMPRETPRAFVRECEFYGADLTLVDGNISDCAARMREVRRPGWFDVSTLKEPFRLEGKKTMGYEMAEQLQWNVPDVVVYPTGGGTGLIGIWKAFREMAGLGWTNGKLPRMVAVQTEACAPIVQAFREGKRRATPCAEPAVTVANGLRVPSAFGDELILQLLWDTHGAAVAVSEAAIMEGIKSLARTEGILLSPEGAAAWSALRDLAQAGWIRPEETVVLLNTGSIYKYMENFA